MFEFFVQAIQILSMFIIAIIFAYTTTRIISLAIAQSVYQARCKFTKGEAINQKKSKQ